jgi:cobalt-zinc-cadmium efflux system outer membrane protein
MTADPHCSLHRAAAICMTAWLCAFASTPLLGQEKSLILRDTAGLFARSMDAAEKRLAAGDIAGADLARMRVDALRAANEARMAEAERAQAALAYLIGAERSSRQLQASDRFPEPGVIAALDPGLIDARPDVRAAEARVKAAESARELARSLRTRDVSVGVQFEHFPTGPNDGASNSYGFGVSIPLFLRHSYEGELRRAEVDLGATRDNLERVRALARGEMERAWSELQSASERVTRYDSGLLQEARRAAEAAEFAYRNGALSIMDLLDARRTLRATQIAREAGGRIVAVKANLIGRDQGSFVAEAQKRVNKEVHLPAGYRVTWAVSSRTSNAPWHV